MDTRSIATFLAAGRIAVGTAAFLAPRRVTGGWLGAVVDDPAARVAVRGLAARDLAIGIGQLAALQDPQRSRAWLEAGILSDAGDAIATWRARRSLPTAGAAGVLAVAVGAAALGVVARTGLPDDGAFGGGQ